MVLVAVCALLIVVGVANAGREPAPAPSAELVPAQAHSSPSTLPPVLPGLVACPGTEHILNIHTPLTPLNPAPNYFLDGKARGMTDEQASAYAAQTAADLQDQLVRTVATLPLPPCP